MKTILSLLLVFGAINAYAQCSGTCKADPEAVMDTFFSTGTMGYDVSNLMKGMDPADFPVRTLNEKETAEVISKFKLDENKIDLKKVVLVGIYWKIEGKFGTQDGWRWYRALVEPSRGAYHQSLNASDVEELVPVIENYGPKPKGGN